MKIGNTNFQYFKKSRNTNHNSNLHKLKVLYLILLNSIISSSLLGQETKLIVNTFAGSKQISEKYYVLKSNKDIKHGEYISYFKISEQDFKNVKEGFTKLERYIKIKSSYSYGKKNGEYLENDEFYSMKTSGKYLDDKKVGIWLTSIEQGQVIEKFDFDTGNKLPPTIKVEIKYPANARENGISGTVSFSYKSNKDCSISDLKIIKSPSRDFDNEIIRVITKKSELQKKYGETCEDTVISEELEFRLD